MTCFTKKKNANSAGKRTSATGSAADANTAPSTVETRRDASEQEIDRRITESYYLGLFENDAIAELWTLEQCLADCTLRYEALNYKH